LPTQIISTVVISEFVAVALGDTGNLVVTRDAVVGSTGDNAAIYATGSGQKVRVDGTVAGYNAISMGNSNTLDNNHQVYVGETGVLSGQVNGIGLYSTSGTITNFGSIDGYTAIRLDGNAGGTSTVMNHGTISGDYGVIVWTTEQLVLFNDGLIEGRTGSVFGGSAADSIRNLGTLNGLVYLDIGNDTYDGRGGKLIGELWCGGGNDIVIPGSGVEVVDGGSGFDTIAFLTGGAIKVYLDDSGENTKAAYDDSYTSIENVTGSRHGADYLVGNEVDNILRGLGGLDSLVGGLGEDTIEGGGKADVVTGGLGNDSFLFLALTESGDTITDFRGVAGDNDLFQISTAFGGGLVAGALSANQFRTGTTAQAGDADDRFIWKTTDHTLWFDVNGNAAGGLTLLAKLDAAATVTAADIFMI
jgi:Ca2+-binding RTX toxin-like protein